MKRRLLNFVTALSLALCFAAAGLCVWSYQRWNLWRLHPDDRRYYSLVFETGSVGLIVTTYDSALWDERWWGRGWNWNHNGRSPLVPQPAPRSVWERMGFYGGELPAERGRRFRERVFVWPAWLPVLVTAAPPALWLVRRARRRSRFAAGLCPSCGYDLRATPDTCPECGTMTPPPVTSTP